MGLQQETDEKLQRPKSPLHQINEKFTPMRQLAMEKKKAATLSADISLCPHLHSFCPPPFTSLGSSFHSMAISNNSF
jgi:hypothetical protein